METWIMQQCMEFGVVLTPEQVNALFFIEGGFSMWGKSSRHPDWTPLAVIMSAADLYSGCALKK